MFELLGRVFEILVAFAMIRSVLTIALRIFRGTSGRGTNGRQGSASPKPPEGNAAPPGGGASSPSTLLHQDPVCGTYVAAGSSLRKICKGKVMHFCSEECRDRYVA